MLSRNGLTRNPNDTSSQSTWHSSAKTVAGIAGDGTLLFLSTIKESSDIFPPLKSAAAGILVLLDVISVR